MSGESRIARFLRARKQSDMVKVQLAFFLAGCCFTFFLAAGVITFYRESTGFAEYVLQGTGEGVGNIFERTEVKAAGRQKETSVQLDVLGEVMTFDCVELPFEYIKAVYKVTENSAMTVFYVNQTAFDTVGRMWTKRFGTVFEADAVYPEYLTEYGEEGTAKLVLLSQIADSGEPFVCRAADNIRLADADQIRVWMKKQDFNEGMQKWFRGIGLEMKDRESMQIWELKEEISLLRVKYELFAAALCFAAAGALRKYGRRDYFID